MSNLLWCCHSAAPAATDSERILGLLLRVGGSFDAWGVGVSFRECIKPSRGTRRRGVEDHAARPTAPEAPTVTRRAGRRLKIAASLVAVVAGLWLYSSE